MGIPAPSLRRLLSKGKTGGVPKGLLALDTVTQAIKGARRKPEIRARELACKAAVKAERRGTLDLEYLFIAQKYGMQPAEVYTLGKSPDSL